MTDTPFIHDFRLLLEKHHIDFPNFAYGSRAFDPKRPSVLYSGPVYDREEIVAAVSALTEGKWSVAGENVYRFESTFSKYVGQKESVMVNSGSSANLLMVAAVASYFGWKNGDGIVVSAVGFPTTTSSIALNNLRPVFVDIEWNTLNADNDAIEIALEKGLSGSSRIRAIFVSPVLGNPPDMDRLMAIASKYGVQILLDGCDSLGSTWAGRHLSDFAVATSCSFFPSHHISTVQGGMISSNIPEIVKAARQMSTWGRGCYCAGSANLLPKGVCGKRFDTWLASCPDTVVDHKYTYMTDKGYNLQPLDMQGAIGLAQMEKIEAIHMARKSAYHKIKLIFEEKLPDLRVIEPVGALAEPSWFGVPAICPNKNHKQKLVAHLEKNGIQTRNYFAGNILLHPGYEKLGDYRDFPVSNRVLEEVFFVGCSPQMGDGHFEHVKSVAESFQHGL